MLVLSCESIFYYQLKQSTFWLVGPVYDLTKISHITVFNFSINCHYVPYIYFNYSIINYCLSWPAFNIRLDIVNGFASLNIGFNYNTPWKLYIYMYIHTPCFWKVQVCEISSLNSTNQISSYTRHQSYC